MSLRKFEAFIRKISRLLYEDDLTPIVIDYMLKHQVAEPILMSRQLHVYDGQTKGEKALKKILDTLEGHGIVVRQELKRRENGPKIAERVKFKYEEIKYPETLTTLSVYSFNIDLMLILKARIFTLRQQVFDRFHKRSLTSHIFYRCPHTCEGLAKKFSELEAQGQGRKCSLCGAALVQVTDEEKLDQVEEQRCREILNDLHEEMMNTFSSYQIPPSFFGPLQNVSYEGIGGNYLESVEDVEFLIQLDQNEAGSSKAPSSRSLRYLKRQKVDVDKLREQVPQIVRFYEEQNLISIKSKAIKKRPEVTTKKSRQ